MRGPDFVLIGAMKCGTTTLAAQLGAQAGIFVTNPKEPNFFSDDAAFARGEGWYEGLFDAARPGDIRGEASTHYTKRPDLPDTVARMQAALPEVRLVYMIRDPMARLVSHWVHAWSRNETRLPFERALAEMPALVEYGRYGFQAAPFVEAWGREAILLTSLERMRADPQAELARVAGHLGHKGPVAWIEAVAVENASSERSRRLPLHGLLVENPVARALRHALVPKAIRSRIREARRLDARPVIPDDRVAGLRETFLADRERLAALFPGDPSLDLAYPWAAP